MGVPLVNHPFRTMGIFPFPKTIHFWDLKWYPHFRNPPVMIARSPMGLMGWVSSRHIDFVLWVSTSQHFMPHVSEIIPICEPWCWYIYLHNWVILFGQMLVNIPYMEQMGSISAMALLCEDSPHRPFSPIRSPASNTTTATPVTADGRWLDAPARRPFGTRLKCGNVLSGTNDVCHEDHGAFL